MSKSTFQDVYGGQVKKILLIAVLLISGLVISSGICNADIILKSGEKIVGEIKKQTNVVVLVDARNCEIKIGKGVYSQRLEYCLDEIKSIDGKEIDVSFEGESIRVKSLCNFIKGVREAGVGHLKEAEDYFNKGLELNKNYDTFKRYLKIMNDLKKGKINEDYALAFFRSVNLREVGYGSLAYEEAKKAVEINPNYPEAYLELAVIYSGRGEECIEYLKKAIQLDPDNTVAYDLLGYAYAAWANMSPPQVSDERYKKAIEYCQKAIQVDPQYVSAYVNLQFIYNKLGRYEESVEMGKKALSLNSYEETAYMNMGYAYRGLNKKEEAVLYYKKAYDIFLAIGNGDAAWSMNESIDRILH